MPHPLLFLSILHPAAWYVDMVAFHIGIFEKKQKSLNSRAKAWNLTTDTLKLICLPWPDYVRTGFLYMREKLM
jgi:hypothetical protein